LCGGHPLAELRAREDQVELRHAREERLELGQGVPHRVGQRGEHSQDFAFLLADRLHQFIVRFHHAFRLDEERGAALRSVVDDAAHPTLRACRHGQDEAAVADRDVPLLEDGVRRGRLKVRLERPHDVLAEIAKPRADAAQGGARLVPDAAVLLERSPQQVGQRLRGREIGEGGGKIGGRLPDAAPIPGEAGCRVEQGNHGGECYAVRHGAGHPHRVEGRPHVGNDLPGRWSRERERGPALSSLVERVRDRLQILGGQETERSLAAHRRARVARQEGPHLGPFDAAVARGYSDIR
jgi:hypothetical protein